MTLAVYRDGGFWTLLWDICWFAWTKRRGGPFPPRGYVGQVFSSSLDTDLHSYRLKSIRLRRRLYTRAVHRWRLTLEWETSQLPSHQSNGGPSSVLSGESSAVGGAAALRRQTRIISTSKRLISESDLHRVQLAPDAGAAGLLDGESLGKPIRAVGLGSDGPRPPMKCASPFPLTSAALTY